MLTTTKLHTCNKNSHMKFMTDQKKSLKFLPNQLGSQFEYSEPSSRGIWGYVNPPPKLLWCNLTVHKLYVFSQMLLKITVQITSHNNFSVTCKGTRGVIQDTPYKWTFWDPLINDPSSIIYNIYIDLLRMFGTLYRGSTFVGSLIEDTPYKWTFGIPS